MKKVPRLSFWQIWNISCSLLGVQFGLALQNTNASRILTSLGAVPHNWSVFWFVATILGLVVQPVLSATRDRPWTLIGRRSPYILDGAIYSIVIPRLILLTPRKMVYSISLILGGIGFISYYLFSNQYYLLLSMVGIGMAWAAIKSMPYAILYSVLPPKRMGIYIGLFNLTVVIPQILSELLEGSILRSFSENQGIYILIFTRIIMIPGSFSVGFV